MLILAENCSQHVILNTGHDLAPTFVDEFRISFLLAVKCHLQGYQPIHIFSFDLQPAGCLARLAKVHGALFQRPNLANSTNSSVI